MKLNTLIQNIIILFVLINITLVQGQSNYNDVLLDPIISATPNPMAFANTYVGQFTQQLLTVENTGTSTLEVTNVSSSDPSFLVMVNPFNLEPGETQPFVVRFQPVVAGYITASIQIFNNSSISPFEVSLSGTGIGPSPTISASPNPLMFDDTYIGSDSQKNLYITNTGLATLTITNFNFPNDAFFTYNNPPITIEPGATHDMVIKFSPFDLGLIEGSVQFISNDPTNPTYEVILSGNSIDDPINGWEWHYTGFNYILMDISFPEGQNQIGFCAGQSLTYNGEGVVIKTTDGGDTWEQMTPEPIEGLQGCSFVTIDTGYAAGWNGYIIKTTNSGETWEELFVASGIYEITDIEFYDADHGVVVGQDNNGAFAFVTDDAGETWTAGTGIVAACYRVTYADENTLFIAANNGYIFKSTDGGYNWSNVSTGSGLMLGLDFINADYGIITGDNGLILKTTDGGNSWETQSVNDNLFHGIFIWDIDTSWVVGTPDLIYKSVDGGTTYTSQYPSYSAWKALYNVIFTDNYTGFICGGSNGIVLRKQGLEMIPNIAVNPSSINFPDTYVNESSAALITVNNTGLATLEVTDIVSTNDAFSIDITTFSVEPGNSQLVEIIFTPDEEVFFEGLIQIASNDPQTTVFDVMVSGAGLLPYPEIIASPAQIVFDTTTVGQSIQEPLTISNTGLATLEIFNISSSNSVFTVDITSTTIEPGNSQDIVVTFTPELKLQYDATLEIENNDPQNGLLEVDLSGYGYILTKATAHLIADDVVIYPNPASTFVYLENVMNSEITISDLVGNLKIKQQCTNDISRINISELPAGTYIIRFARHDGIISRKLELIK